MNRRGVYRPKLNPVPLRRLRVQLYPVALTPEARTFSIFKSVIIGFAK